MGIKCEGQPDKEAGQDNSLVVIISQRLGLGCHCRRLGVCMGVHTRMATGGHPFLGRVWFLPSVISEEFRRTDRACHAPDVPGNRLSPPPFAVPEQHSPCVQSKDEAKREAHRRGRVMVAVEDAQLCHAQEGGRLHMCHTLWECVACGVCDPNTDLVVSITGQG
ncbi:unnamed protein product [Discosporangium mesarthrocarpum]